MSEVRDEEPRLEPIDADRLTEAEVGERPYKPELEEVTAETVNIQQGGAQTVKAEKVFVEQGGIGRAEGRFIDVKEGGIAIAQGENVTITDGGVAIVAAENVKMEDAMALFVAANQIEGEDFRILVDVRAAAVFALVLGAVLTLLKLLVSRND